MAKLGVCGVKAMLLLTCFVMLCPSCVNEEYDMSEDNLNLEITPFGEGLTLPLGSTEKIQLKDLLKDVDTDILSSVNGAYSVSVSDEFDMTEDLASLTDLVEIQDVDFSQKFNFNLDNVDVSDIKVEAQDFPFEHDLSASFNAPEVKIPSVNEGFSRTAGIDKYVPQPDQLAIDYKGFSAKETVLTLGSAIRSLIPASLRNNDPIDLDLVSGPYASCFELVEFGPFDQGYNLNISLPKGVSSVEQILLNDNARIKVSISLDRAFIKSGSISPDIEVDFSNLFNLKGSEGSKINLSKGLTLSDANGFKAEQIYYISSLAVSSDDWKADDEGVLHLDKMMSMTYGGSVGFKDLTTTTNLLTDEANSVIGLTVDIEFFDLNVKDVKMAIEDVEVVVNEDVDLSLDVDVPTEIEKIEYVEFQASSGVDLNIEAKNLSRLTGVSATLSSLVISFPDQLVVDGADSDNRITISGENLANGLKRHIGISRVNLPAPSDGKISLDETIKVEAVVIGSGTVNSSLLPTSSEDDIQIDVKVTSDFEIENYEVSLSPYNYDLDIEPQEIKVEIPDDLKDLKEVVVYPEGTPEISITMNLPEMPLDIRPSAEKGLNISFPKMLKFKTLPASYNYNEATHSISFNKNEAVPTKIVLPIDRLVITPELDPADNKYYAKGSVEISGGLTLSGGNITKADVDKLTADGNKVSVVAHVPEMTPSTLELDNYQTSIEETVELDILSKEDVPEELVSVGIIELRDVFINLSLDATELPDLGTSTLSIDLDVTLPEMLKVEGATEDGKLHLSGVLGSSKMINMDPIKVNALDLSTVDIKEGIKDELVINGAITLSDASIDIDEWLKGDLSVMFNAGIKDIEISKLTGKVDYSLEPVVEEVDLSDFKDMLSDLDADVNLDFNHAHLALEIDTNLDVEVNADVELVPYYDGVAGENTVKASLNLRGSETGDRIRFWLAEREDNRCPEGYELIEVENLMSLFNNIPDKLEVKLEGGTDPEKDITLEPLKEYELKINYLFELPLEFGEDFAVTYKTKVTGIPEIVGTILSDGNKIKLAGKIENSLPLGLDLKLNFLDSNDKVVPVAGGFGEQTIYPCNQDGSPRVTDLGIVVMLENGAKAEDISSLELTFYANSGGVTGVPVKEDAYLQAMLQFVLPEGVTVDLNDFINEE